MAPEKALSPPPKVSVVMVAFNEVRMIRRAIESILAQTLDDFELIVIDDGSTDGTGEVIASVKDPRLISIAHARNQGMCQSRNEGIAAAGGRYIAIFDADDVSHPQRLERQARFLDENPGIALCGTWGHLNDETSNMVELRQPVSSEEIRRALPRTCPIIDSSLMARAEMLKRHPYDPALPRAVDYDLFWRISRTHAMANIPEFLIVFETSRDRRYHWREQYWKTVVRWRALTRYGQPLRQAFWLLAPLPLVLMPSGLKWRLRKHFLNL